MASLSAQRQQISSDLEALAATLPPKSARRPSARPSRSAPRLGGASPGGYRRPGSCARSTGRWPSATTSAPPAGGGRRHLGNDLLSPRGTPNVAVVSGTVETRPWAGGGITIFLRGDDGHTYVYMHLMRIEGAVPRRVVPGEVIGLVGSTGNSYGYHTHFEYHPDGGIPVSPYPLLSASCR